MSNTGLARGVVEGVARHARLGIIVALCALGLGAHAGPLTPEKSEPPGAETAQVAGERTIAQWMDRMHKAPCVRPYAGTFVVWAAPGALASSRIWHACDGALQLERVEALSGTPRTTFRRNDEVRTFFPQAQLVRSDRRDAAGLFPRVAVVDGTSMSQFYVPRSQGQERVAGLMADVVWFKPTDMLRFGYRLWSERDTGLVVKLQTLGSDGRVLEQAAFSELDLNAPVRVEQLARMMDATAGYKVVAPAIAKTTAAAEGWGLRQPVAGFVPVSCHRRSVSATDEAPSVLQCLYSDGFATVSLFMEPFNPEKHSAQPQASGIGATQVLAQRISSDTWLTAVGEVPLPTLRLFAGQLERLR